MTRIPPLLLLCGVAIVTGCDNEPPPRSVEEFIDNPIMLEAAVVRCSQNRAESRYDAECVNARQAVSIIEAKEERARRDALERQSAAKREASSTMIVCVAGTKHCHSSRLKLPRMCSA